MKRTVFKKPADQWMIQAGISKNWFGYGATSSYGEYGVANDWGADFANAANTYSRSQLRCSC